MPGRRVPDHVEKKAHELHLDRGELGEVRQAAERGLTADPYFEPLYRDLMRAASAAGNTAEVRDVMQRLRNTLADDADANDADGWLDPGTVRLYHELSSQPLGASTG